VPASADRVFGALEDVLSYASWWPQMRIGNQTGPASGDLVIRSALPYELRVHLERSELNEDGRFLVARMSGDLVGSARWSVQEAAASPGGAIRSVAQFDEDIEAASPVLRRLGPLARPAFIANHALMMRDGERGLRRHLLVPAAQ
jgi:hypothetical protein